jgi:hypothetical protein
MEEYCGGFWIGGGGGEGELIVEEKVEWMSRWWIIEYRWIGGLDV